MLGRALNEYKPPPSSRDAQVASKVAALKQIPGNAAQQQIGDMAKNVASKTTRSISDWAASSAASPASNSVARTSSLQNLPGTTSTNKRPYSTMAGTDSAARLQNSFDKVSQWKPPQPTSSGLGQSPANRSNVIDLEADIVDLTRDEAPRPSCLPATKVVEYDWDDDFENDSEIDIDMEYPLELPKLAPQPSTPQLSSKVTAPQPDPTSSMLPPKTPTAVRDLPIASSAQSWSSSPVSHLKEPSTQTAMPPSQQIDLTLEPESSEPPKAAKRRALPWHEEQARQKAALQARSMESKLQAVAPRPQQMAPKANEAVQKELCYICKQDGHYPAGCPQNPKNRRMNIDASRFTRNANPFDPLGDTGDASVQWMKTAREAKLEQKRGKRSKNTLKNDREGLPILEMMDEAAHAKGEKQYTKAQTSKEKGGGKIFLSQEQQNTLNLVIEKKKSIFFTGSAGTGKSVLMRAIINELRQIHRREPEKVAVTASTGLAACNIGGVTLHSFSGIGLGKEPVPELVKKIMRNQKAKNRWLKCKILIIDEISMVDGGLFDKLEAIARLIKKNNRPFGGIQLVVTGDFFQLPPVPDSGRQIKFAFDADTWSTTIHHTIGLTEVFRQRDPVFANMLNEMRLGRITDETIKAFRRLERPLPPHKVDATELFPTRKEVDNSNFVKMRNLPGTAKVFVAEDGGTVKDKQQAERLLSNFMAPKILELKKGAQVMLIKNMDESLVNGSLGRVTRFASESMFNKYQEGLIDDMYDSDKDGPEPPPLDENGVARIRQMAATAAGGPRLTATTDRRWPVVSFVLADGQERELLCMPEDWKVELPNGEIQAQRRQVPLILAWALSIHKAQGQTLERVKVDLKRVFENGQAYVALSRATTAEGLQVQNFNAKAVMAHPRVGEFYNSLYSVNKALKHPTVAAAKKEDKKVAKGEKESKVTERKLKLRVEDMPDDTELFMEDDWAADEEAYAAYAQG